MIPALHFGTNVKVLPAGAVGNRQPMPASSFEIAATAVASFAAGLYSQHFANSDPHYLANSELHCSAPTVHCEEPEKEPEVTECAGGAVRCEVASLAGADSWTFEAAALAWGAGPAVIALTCCRRRRRDVAARSVATRGRVAGLTPARAPPPR